jgi:hypothetical protein
MENKGLTMGESVIKKSTMRVNVWKIIFINLYHEKNLYLYLEDNRLFFVDRILKKIVPQTNNTK